MADNYLERREEQLRERQGSSYRNHALNLEQLLAKCNFTSAEDPSYKVHDLQLDAIISVARNIHLNEFTFSKLRRQDTDFPEAVASVAEYSYAILVSSCQTSGSQTLVQLGETIMAMRLKAAEMGLMTETFYGEIAPAEGVYAIVAVGKNQLKF